MIVNIPEYVGCEYFYFKEIFNIVKKSFGDNYNVIVGRATFHNKQTLDDALQTVKSIKPNKKNILLMISEETEDSMSYESLKSIDLIFRTYNNDLKFDNNKIFPVPCGYVTKVDFPYHKEVLNKFDVKPLKNRKYDIFFSGQSTVERNLCVNEAKKLKANSLVQLTNGFVQGYKLNEYFEYMNNAKIALVPKGSLIAESFRYFDAYHSNCIVITTIPLDKTHKNLWYYHDSPAIKLNNWLELSQKLIDTLLNDIEKYELLNKAYYNKCISIEGVAKYITEIIKTKLEA